MIRFNSDYTEGAHPEILEALIRTNELQSDGYGADPYCGAARKMIQTACGDPDVDVHFFVGGTQTNFTLIAAALRPYQSVLSAATGHIFVHESGAIEATGHKCETLPTVDGKIRAADIEAKLEAHRADESFEHATQPKLVYLSQPTELGTLYTRQELTKIRAACDRYDIFLYIDGARIVYALTSEKNDADLKTIARIADAFYFGGTKAGLLFGEALIIRSDTLKRDFRYIQKQRGGLLAKGRLLGVQFATLFEASLYEEIGRHANRAADKIREALREMRVRFLVASPTNQIFPIFPDGLIRELREDFALAYIQRVSESESCVRICTSFATRDEDVEALIARVRSLLDKNR